jgi:5'-nucleotidase
MSVDLSQILVIGVSSRALFDLEEENTIFNEKGLLEFRKYQYEHENELLKPGTAFYLVKSLLELNKQASKPIVEVVVMSRNSPETGVRVMNSIKVHGLDISRLAFTGGESLYGYIAGYDVDLFLSMDPEDVQKVIDSGSSAAALIYAPPSEFNSETSRVKIAFDADAVLFSDDSEFRYKTEGLDAFQKHEKENEKNAMKEGPFAKLLIKLSTIQEHLPMGVEMSPLRLAIITARSAPSHLRVINTLREWGVYIDEVHFLGGLSKDKILATFGAHIFFDDQEAHLGPASKVVPSGKVPYATGSKMEGLNKNVNN